VSRCVAVLRFSVFFGVALAVSPAFWSEAQVQPRTSSNRPSKRPITIADCVGMTRLEAPDYFDGSSSVAHFSPDGKKFVVVLRKGNLRQNTNDFSLLLYHTTGALHSPKPDGLVKMSSSSNRDAISKIRWLADNETVVFLGENPNEVSQVYALKTRTKTLKKLTNHPTPINNYDISSDGREIAFEADPPESKVNCVTDGSCKSIVIEGQNLLDIVTGRYTPREGQQVFWQTSNYPPRRVPVGQDYLIAQLPFSLSPDGHYLAFSTLPLDRPSEWASYQNPFIQKIFAANTPKGRMSSIQEYMLFDTRAKCLVPLVGAPMIGFDPISWARDGKSVFLMSYLPLDVADPVERKAREQNKYPIEVDLRSREFRKVSKEEFPASGIEKLPLEVTLDQDVNTPPKLYVSDPASRQKGLLIDLNPQFGELDFGTVKTIEWKVNGVEMLAGLYMPPDYEPGKRYPLVIQTHGFLPNEFSMDGRSEWSSGFAARPLAARNILVLQTQNFKHQQDYERSHQEARFGATLEESAKNFIVTGYETAIDYLDGEGLIDRNRVGIIGFSRTVCFVGYALTHSKYRFAAASLVDGLSCGYVETIAFPEVAWDSYSINGGAAPFGEGLKMWMKNSPGFNLDKVKTPVQLTSHSGLEAWEWFAGLTLQKKPVDFVLIPGGEHIGVKLSERTLAQQGIVDWFAFWLKGEEDPDPSKRDQYNRWRDLIAMSSGGSK
jgi:dipeptidyl aminopeptidase/acylaminoacyl peptidase